MSKQKKYSQYAAIPANNRRYGDGPIGRFYNKHQVPSSAVSHEFNYVKYFRQDEQESPLPLRDLLAEKLAPAPGYQSGSGPLTLRSDFILPTRAPRDINSVDELIAHFDRTPPLRRDVMVEMKFMLHDEGGRI